MSKKMPVVLVAALSMDGFIARHKDELADWTTKEDKQFFVKITKELGTMVMGRTTFATIGRALPGRRMIVLTSTPEKYDVKGVEFTNETPKQLVTRLESEGVTGLAVCGGAHVYTDFLVAGIVDELVLSVVDVELGGGIRLITEAISLDAYDYVSGEYISEYVSVQKLIRSR
jgi:dihydrofolate reductase